jgi:hypothetical protein
LFTLGSLLKITEVAHFFGYLFPQLRLCIDFLQKTGLASFWAIFSQTHLVTLLAHEVKEMVQSTDPPLRENR